MLAAGDPFLDVLWTFVAFFALLFWIWLLVKVVADIIRKWRFGGRLVKALWIILIIALPYLGVWVYLVTRVLVDDLLPRNDLGDGAKVLWILGFVFLPTIGVLIYLVSERVGMAERGTSLAKITGGRNTKVTA